MTRRTLRSVALFLVVYAIAVGVLLLLSAPLRPRTTLGWILFVALGPPLAAALEWLGGRFTSGPGAAALERRTAHKQLSAMRIVYLTVWFLILLGAALGAIYLLSLWFPGLGAFFSQNFG